MMSSGALALMLAALIGALIAALMWIPPLFRKRCPRCAKKRVATHGFDTQAASPRVFRVYECVGCRIEYASADGRVLVPRDQWDAGVRDGAAEARVVRGGGE